MKYPNAVVPLSVLVAGILGVGVWWWVTSTVPHSKPSPPPSPRQPYESPGDFKDDVTSNGFDQARKLPLEFLDSEGKAVRLDVYQGKKNVVLVFMRGITKNPGGVCLSCSTQASRLAANYKEFSKRDTEVVIVFPGDKESVAQFIGRARGEDDKGSLPFPVLLDEGYKVVDQLGISADRAKPSTFLLDKQGQVRFAYVGETTTDRPSLKALYKQLDDMTATKP